MSLNMYLDTVGMSLYIYLDTGGMSLNMYIDTGRMSLYMYLDTVGMFYLEYTWGRKAGGSRSRPCIHTGRVASTRTWTRSDKKLSTALWWVYSGKWPLRCWGRPVWYTSHQLKTQKNHVRADTEQNSVISHDDNIESQDAFLQQFQFIYTVKYLNTVSQCFRSLTD